MNQSKDKKPLMPATTADAPAAEQDAWKLLPDHSAEISELEATMRKNRAQIETLRPKHPSVWHMDYTLADYARRINTLAGVKDADIEHLTVECLIVRASTDSAEFQWRTRPESADLESQIGMLVEAVRGALHCIASRKGAFQAAEDEKLRSLYETHIATNLSVLEMLIAPGLDREERAEKASLLRKRDC